MALNESPAYVLPIGAGGATRRALAVHGGVMLKLAAAVLATALAAQVRIGGPVPVTLQTVAVLLSGFALGRRWAPLSMLAYLALGAAGLPFFAVGLFGPTGGYILGFVPAAAFVGRFGHAGAGSWVRTAAVAALGASIIFALGLAGLAVWFEGALSTALAIGLLPFWPGEAVKIAVVVAAVHAWRRTGGGGR